MSARPNAVARTTQSAAYLIRNTRMGSDAPAAQDINSLHPMKPAGMWREAWAQRLMQISPSNRLPRGFSASIAVVQPASSAQSLAVQAAVAVAAQPAISAPLHDEPRSMTLRECLPSEFMGCEYDSAASRKWADVEVVAKFDSSEHPWPGKEKNVNVWYGLANGRAVGFNENPARGWSFPLIKWDGETKN